MGAIFYTNLVNFNMAYNATFIDQGRSGAEAAFSNIMQNVTPKLPQRHSLCYLAMTYHSKRLNSIYVTYTN